GIQPTSSSNPTSISRSASLAALIKLGRASRKWGSSGPFTKTVISALSPPTSRAMLPRSGTVAHTFRGPAAATTAAPSTPAPAITLRIQVTISTSVLVRMRRMGAEQHFQAQVQRVRVPARQVVRDVVVVLQPQPRKLREIPNDQRREPLPVIPIR